MFRYLFLLALCLVSWRTSIAQDRPIVGAIRWDAWLGQSDGVGAQLNRSLGPNHWHSRLPFFAKVIDANTVDIDGTSQLVADAEIEYAAYARLDYFAFLMYDDQISLSNGLHKYLSSSKNDQLNFCVIMSQISTEPITTSVKRVLAYIQKSNYQHVLGDRPLVYAYNLENAPQLALALKDSCAARHWPRPYIVSLQYADQMPSSSVYDAITCYWYNGTQSGGSETGAPYSTLMHAAQLNWQVRLENGTKQIPLVSLGADGRPRIEHPVSWIPDPASIYKKYFESPQPQEITQHLKQAFNFIENNPLSCEANTVLMYAWNENDEGGWLMPTLENDAHINTARIDSLRSFRLNDSPLSSAPLEHKRSSPNDQMAVFPNPTTDSIRILISSPSQLVVRNSSGLVLLESTLSESQTLSFSKYPPGIYFLELRNKNQNYIQKLIKK
ncbi:MAG TPA: T9SS type A sorting domain-containing protein [Prolixibacteraceae bacterium]|jgi:hypothetical protein